MEKANAARRGPSEGESNALNWLRGLFALLVLGGHTRQHLLVPYAEWGEQEFSPFVWGFYFVTAFGSASVVGFFVLSGYLITLRYFRQLQDGSLSALGFLLGRGVRLYMVLVPVLLWSGLVMHFSPLDRETSVKSFFAHLLFLEPLPIASFAGNRPLWSLGYEAWCYVVFCGWVGGAFQLRRGEQAKGLAWLLVGFLPLLIFSLWMAHYLILWALGAAAALYAERAHGAANENAVRRRWAIFAVALTLCGFLAARLGIRPPLRDYAIAVPLAASLALFSGASVRPSRGMRQLGAVLAGFSYSLYLTHFPLVLLAEYFLGGTLRPSVESIAWCAAVVAGCIGFAYAFAALTERHTSSVRSWLGRKIGIDLRPAG